MYGIYINKEINIYKSIYIYPYKNMTIFTPWSPTKTYAFLGQVSPGPGQVGAHRFGGRGDGLRRAGGERAEGSAGGEMVV